jgi:hypothetical protein
MQGTQAHKALLVAMSLSRAPVLGAAVGSSTRVSSGRREASHSSDSPGGGEGVQRMENVGTDALGRLEDEFVPEKGLGEGGRGHRDEPETEVLGWARSGCWCRMHGQRSRSSNLQTWRETPRSGKYVPYASSNEEMCAAVESK